MTLIQALALRRQLPPGRLWPEGLRRRSAALHELWRHRGHWRLLLARKLMRRERDQMLGQMVPAVLIISLMAGILLFVTLSSALGDAAGAALATLWPAWGIQVAPVAAAQLLVMQRMPGLALELSQRHARGETAALFHLQASPAAYPCVPLLAAHACTTAAASFILVGLSLLLGFGAAFVIAVGDLRQMADNALSLVSPLDWMRSGLTAGLLGLVASLATMIYAWPSSLKTLSGVEAHRLGLRAMMVSSASVLAAALALNWLLNLLGFLKWW